MARHSLLKSWAVSVEGLVTAIRTERNVALTFGAAVLAVIIAALLRVTLFEWVIVVLCIGLVITTELVNTAIESVTDLAIGEEIHPLAKMAKDTASAATLIASATSLIIAVLVFGPYLLELFWG